MGDKLESLSLGSLEGGSWAAEHWFQEKEGREGKEHVLLRDTSGALCQSFVSRKTGHSLTISSVWRVTAEELMMATK